MKNLLLSPFDKFNNLSVTLLHTEFDNIILPLSWLVLVNLKDVLLHFLNGHKLGFHYLLSNELLLQHLEIILTKISVDIL